MSEMTTSEYRAHIDRTKSEADFQREVIDLAQVRGWRVAHFRSVQIQRKDGATHWATPVQGDGEGFPDLILLRGNRGVALELKSASGRVTEAQLEWLQAFRDVGFEADVMRPQHWPAIEEMLK